MLSATCQFFSYIFSSEFRFRLPPIAMKVCFRSFFLICLIAIAICNALGYFHERLNGNKSNQSEFHYFMIFLHGMQMQYPQIKIKSFARRGGFGFAICFKDKTFGD